MFPPPELLAAARILTGLSQERLAAEARVGLMTVKRLEQGGTDTRTSTLSAIVGALLKHGVKFVPEDDEIRGGILLLKRASAPSTEEGAPTARRRIKVNRSRL